MSINEIPQSMLDRPCVHCGSFDVRFDEERGRWYCVCLWNPAMRYHEAPEQPEVAQPKVVDFWNWSKKVS